MGCDLVKKISVLILVNIFLITVPIIIGGKPLLLSFFVPALLSYILIRVMFSKTAYKEKSRAFLWTSIVSIIISICCCLFEMFYGWFDAVDSIFVCCFSAIFNSTPLLACSIFNFLLSLLRKEQR